MSTEIDLVRAFMDESDETQLFDLLVARSALNDAIQLEVALTGAEPADRPQRHSVRPLRRRLIRLGVGLSVAAALVAVAVVVAPTSQTPARHQSASAIIGRLADYAQPLPALGAGQWYQYQLQGEMSAQVTSGTKASPVNATANIPIAIGDWSSSSGAVCASEQFGNATFATSADAAAWATMGLITTPANQPATGCVAGLEASQGGGGTPIKPTDVSSITHDPATLATELQDGTTGISAVDHYGDASSPHALAFLRLTNLLLGPLTGQWSGFNQEMLNTMALLPGITSLGSMTTHSGEPGLGFSFPAQVTLNSSTGAVLYKFTPPTVILDAHSGSLLEVRNYDFPILQNAAQDFVGSMDAMVYADGVSYGTTAQWLDPVSGLSIVDQSSIPSWISTYHVIEAITTPTASEQQLDGVVNPYLGNGNSAYTNGGYTCTPPPSGGGVPSCAPKSGVTTYDITIMGSATNVQNVASALQASGLFTSVTVLL
jgi:hypothetical protein